MTTPTTMDTLVSELEGLGVVASRGLVLASYTTWKIGGPADLFIEITSAAALPGVLAALKRHAMRWVVLGNGSNVLVADQGFRGAVLWLGGELAAVSIARDASGPGRHRVQAGAGLSLTRLLRLAKDEQLSGLWVLGGIPGTVGGAVRMNAGTRWGEVKDTLSSVTLATADGLLEVPAAELGLSYRHSRLPFGAVVAFACFEVGDADPAMRDRLDEVLAHRKATQPLQLPSCGSVFANPPGDSAGRLIDEVGLKGHRIGDCEISQVHANWIVNLGAGTARDVMALIALAQDRVAKRFGIMLRPEVVRIGEQDPTEPHAPTDQPSGGTGGGA